MRYVRVSTGRPPAEDAVSWCPAGLEGVEALAARYSRQCFEPHQHDGFLIGVIESGAHAVWCRGERHLAGPGTLATMDPCEAHHGGAGHPGGGRQRMLYVSPATVAEVLEDVTDASLADRAPHFRQCFWRDEALAGRFLEVHRMLDDTAAIALERQSCFEALLAAVFFLIQLRVDAARPLLANGLSPVEVAAALGFSDQSHFIRRFKAVVGVTPNRWQMSRLGHRT